MHTLFSILFVFQKYDLDLKRYIMFCFSKAIDTHCSMEQNNDEGDLIECLIAHKNDPDVKSNVKCRVNIEHFQIISLKDYHFSFKFKTACKSYAMRFCRAAKTKASVVACLSEKVRNDTVNGLRSDIQKECRQQLRAQLFQQRENVDLDPELKEACREDIKTYCKNVDNSNGYVSVDATDAEDWDKFRTLQVLECLQSTSSKLTDSCHRVVFKLKKQEILDNSIDYSLMTMCADTIQQFCPQTSSEHVLDCLKVKSDFIHSLLNVKTTAH